MSFDKEKENGPVNGNFYTHTLHQLYNSGASAFNTSPASSPSTYSIYANGNTAGNMTNTPSFTNRYPISLQQKQQQQQQQQQQPLMATPEMNPATTSNASNNAAAVAAASPSATPHLSRQLTYAQISRQSSSPHHHARTAAAVARNTPVSSAVTITDPNDPNKMFANNSGPNGKSLHKNTDEADDIQSWTTLDMGGMGLKNISPALCNYRFLTALYINHNNLTFLMPWLSQLSSLKILDVSGNKLTMLPPELGLLSNLRELFAFDNNLVSLPSEFGCLYQLETLGLEGNPIQADLKNLLIKEGTQAVIISLRENAPVGMPPPHREWLLVEGDTTDDPDKFTVLSYNILCQKYATGQLYGYTPSWALSWDYRRELIVSEILGYNADVLCLQEVEMGQFEDYFKDHFKRMGDYESIFHPKTRAKTMSEKERRSVDGCAIFYKSTRFKLIDQEIIEYNQRALARSDFKQTADIYNRVMNKDNIGIFAMLEDKNTQQRVLVVNTHTHWSPSDGDVKLVQVGMMMEEIEKFSKKHLKEEGSDVAYSSCDQLPLVICGDYNSTPVSGVYEFLSKGSLHQKHRDFGEYSYGNYTTEGLSHPFSLRSCYNSIGELDFTNYTPGFKGTLDYIWYANNTLDVISILGPIDHDYISKVVGFPNAHFPSDHISLMAELKYKPSHKEPVKVDFSSTLTQNRSKQ